MLTLKPHPENIEICKLVSGKGKRYTPIYYHPRIETNMMNAVEDLNSFNHEDFRDDFELSQEQANNIFDSLKKEVVHENMQSKYFQVKRHVKNALLTSMDISDTTQNFVVDFNKDAHEYSGHMLVCSGTGGGKTHFVVQMILRNLNGPKAQRRHFAILSAEWDRDKTLAEIKKDKYRDFVHGIGISDNDLTDSEFTTREQFFESIQMRISNMPRGSVVVGDDYMDSFAPLLFKNFFNGMLRTARHDGLSLIMILHSIRSGSYSAQAYNSVKYLVLFPRSQKAKIINYLNKDIGLPMRECKDIVRRYSQTGRWFILNLHMPNFILNKKLIQLL